MYLNNLMEFLSIEFQGTRVNKWTFVLKEVNNVMQSELFLIIYKMQCNKTFKTEINSQVKEVVRKRILL